MVIPRGGRNRYLVPYETKCVPDLENVFIDKLHLVFPLHTLRFNDIDMLRAYFDMLGSTPLFSASITDRVMTLKVRQGWLFSGELKFKVTSRSRQALGTASLFLNPTRFYAHQGASTRNLLESDAGEILRRNPDNERHARRYSLDGDDNLLSPQRTFTRRPFIASSQIYIQKVQELIDWYMTSRGDAPWNVENDVDYDVVPYMNWNEWRLLHSEIYWEYVTGDAVSLVHSLHGELTSALNEVGIVEYRQPRAIPDRMPTKARHRTRNNAVSVTANLGAKDLNLVTYAKEYDRVRFEVRYQKNARTFFGANATTSEIGNDLDGLEDMFNLLAADAKRRLGQLLAVLDPSISETSMSLRRLLQLLSAVNEACSSDKELTVRLLTLLCRHRAFSVPPDDDLQPIAATLAQRKILKRVSAVRRSTTRRYRLAQKFRPISPALLLALNAAE